MKTYSWLNLIQRKMVRAGIAMALAALVVACSEDEIAVNPSNGQGGGGKNAPKSANAQKDSNSNSESSAGDYNITVTKECKVWTYVITKNGDAKDLSHFILDLNNCPWSTSLNISSIVSATVNGQPAVLESSEGNTGCDVASVTSNIVKFDDLPDAPSYTIVFELNHEYGNALMTTAWLKAGNSCHAYVVNGPCCPL
jgi:hypothetical protein